MPVLRSSASDYTHFVRAQAVLPYNGKVTKTTVTMVNMKIAAVVAIASKVAATAAPATTVYVAPTVTSRGNHKGD